MESAVTGGGGPADDVRASKLVAAPSAERDRRGAASSAAWVAPAPASELALRIDVRNDLARHAIIELFPALVRTTLASAKARDAITGGYFFNDSMLGVLRSERGLAYEPPQVRLRRRAGGSAWSLIVRVRGVSNGDVLPALLRALRPFGRARQLPSATEAPFGPVLQLPQVTALPARIRAVASGASLLMGHRTFAVPQPAVIPALPDCVWKAFHTPMSTEPFHHAWADHVARAVGLLEAAGSVFDAMRAPFLCLTVVDPTAGVFDVIGTHRAACEARCFDRIATVARDLLGKGPGPGAA